MWAESTVTMAALEYFQREHLRRIKMAKPKKSTSRTEDESFNYIVRIANSDIDGQKKIVIGLQNIKGIGARTAQTIANKSSVDKTERLGALDDDKVKELEELVQSYVDYAPSWAINRQFDYESGADIHLLGIDLDMVRADDVNRMKMIRSYRGIRHETHMKVRGQKTRTNGRRGLTLGVKRK